MKKILTLALVLAAAGCSSKKKGEEISAEQKEKNQPTRAGKAANWDYEKVRQVRQLEAEENAKNPTPGDKGASCQVMSKSQMIRAGLSGCTPVDARSGMGEGNYCCPRE